MFFELLVSNFDSVDSDLHLVVSSVTIGTWNVAGRHPDEDLEIDDWLSTEEPADMYIIG